MALLEQWRAVAYDETLSKDKLQQLWAAYFQEEKEIGSNVHKVYSSDVLGEYLYRCHELSEITLMNNTLYITYFAEDEDMVILAYSDDGLTEMAVHDADTDTLFHKIDGKCVVWNKFRTGFQCGK